MYTQLFYTQSKCQESTSGGQLVAPLTPPIWSLSTYTTSHQEGKACICPRNWYSSSSMFRSIFIRYLDNNIGVIIKLWMFSQVNHRRMSYTVILQWKLSYHWYTVSVWDGNCQQRMAKFIKFTMAACKLIIAVFSMRLPVVARVFSVYVGMDKELKISRSRHTKLVLHSYFHHLLVT